MSPQFHITIGAASHSGFDVSHDLTLVKAALFYADTVKLCSPTRAIVFLTSPVATLPEDQWLELVRTFAVFQGQAAQFDHNVEMYRRLRRKRRRTTQELVTYHSLKTIFDRTWQEAETLIETMVNAAGARGMIAALNAHLVEVHRFSDSSTAGIVQEFFSVVSDAVASGNTYPLFDDQAGNLLRLTRAEGKRAPAAPRVARGKYVGLAADLLQRLPLFEQATIDEVADIRKELAQPLRHFRAAIIGYSEKVRDAAWDRDFGREAEQLFHQNVAPAVQEIEEAVRAQRYISRYGRRPTETGRIGAAHFGVVLSTVAALVDISTTVYDIGADATVQAMATQREWGAERRKSEQNQLYFYYQVEQGLAKTKQLNE